MQRGILLATTLLLFLLFCGLVTTYLSGLLLVPISMTPKQVVKEIISHMKLKRGEKLLDLGSGDGRILFAASAAGAKGIGYELSPILTTFYKVKSWFYLKLRKRITVTTDSFFKAELSKVDKIYCYLNNRALKALVPHFASALRKDALVYSYKKEIPNAIAVKAIKLSNEEVLYIYNKKSFT